MTYFNILSEPILTEADLLAMDDMFIAVRCTHCQGIYDLGKVEVTGRYVDCSMWRSPCCNKLVDDRGETGWKSFKNYVRIERGLR